MKYDKRDARFDEEDLFNRKKAAKHSQRRPEKNLRKFIEDELDDDSNERYSTRREYK